MHKKILAICAPLVAFAVVPAMASASPHLTTSGGTAVATGTSLKGVNSGSVVFTSSLGNIECKNSSFVGSLKTNSGKLIEASVSNLTMNTEAGECASTFFGGPSFSVTSPSSLCLSTSTLGSGSILSGVCSGAGSWFMTFHSSTLGSCTYSANSVPVTYSTFSSPLHLTVSKVKFTGPFCPFGYPTEIFMDATYKLTTSAGGELKIT